MIKHCIQSSYEIDGPFNFPPYFENENDHAEYVSLDRMVQELFETHSKNTYFLELAKQYDRNDIFDFLAKIWVIVRFDDEGTQKELRRYHDRQRSEGNSKYITMLDDDHPLVKNEKLLRDHSYLLSLLTYQGPNSYNGESFVIAEQYEIAESFPLMHLPRHFMMSIFSHLHRDEPELSVREPSYFPAASKAIIKVGQRLDHLMESRDKTKIEYLSSLLRAAGQHGIDERHRLVVLVSIIEMLVTHSPDFNRFNVEDSISKQFQLKASLLIYANDNSLDLDVIKRRLKTIYTQRSNIAHGNFNELNKYIRGLSKKDGAEEHFFDLIEDLYSYLKAIILEFIKNPTYVDFLKKN